MSVDHAEKRMTQALVAELFLALVELEERESGADVGESAASLPRSHIAVIDRERSAQEAVPSVRRP